MKADNILTDQDGMCKISDFGTSKKSSELASPGSTMLEADSILLYSRYLQQQREHVYARLHILDGARR